MFKRESQTFFSSIPKTSSSSMDDGISSSGANPINFLSKVSLLIVDGALPQIGHKIVVPS